jgi:tRNA(adenine34) deaminase
MTRHESEASDMTMMRRCVALAQSAGSMGEYPFAAVIGRRGEFICESINMVRNEGDVTRHAEMVAISSAQKKLRSTSLDECTIYSTIEPCAMCSYAIRESRIARVMFGLRSPVMGGNSRWDILTDAGLSSTLPEVFAPPPDVLPGCLHREVFPPAHLPAAAIMTAVAELMGLCCGPFDPVLVGNLIRLALDRESGDAGV